MQSTRPSPVTTGQPSLLSRLLSRLPSRQPTAPRRHTRPPAGDAFALEMLEPRLLLSADLTFAAAAGEALNLTTRLDSAAQRIELVDTASQNVLASQALADFGAGNRVVVSGGGLADRLVVDYRAGSFGVEVVFDGGTPSAEGADALQVLGTDNQWTVSGADSGAVVAASPSGGVGSIRFSQVGTLAGGNGTDVLALGPGASLSGQFDGGAGFNRLDTSANAAGQTVALTANGALGGFNGSLAALLGGFRNLQAWTAGAGTDTLVGTDADTRWDASGNSLRLSAGGAGFDTVAVEQAQGGQGVDTFFLAGTVTGLLAGGGGDDVFRLIPGVLNRATLDGGLGRDTLDAAFFTTGRVWQLTGTGSVDGFAGDDNGTGLFTNLDALVGGSGTDTLGGLATGPAAWVVDSQSSYSANGRSLAFSGVDSLAGGAGAETFAVRATASLLVVQAGDGDDQITLGADGVLNSLAGTVVVQGGGGSDQLTLDDAADTTRNTGALGAGTVSGLGLGGGVQHGGVESLTLRLAANANTLTLSGSAAGTTTQVVGSDALPGDTFRIDGDVAADLLGNGGNDRFQFSGAGRLTGRIDGGSGTDTLDFAGLAMARSVQLGAAGATDGLSGTEAAVSAGFSNIDALVGSSAADTVAGADVAARWTLSLLGTQYDNGARLALNGFETLQGGAAADSFTVAGRVSANLLGRGGDDRFAFNAFAQLTGSVDGGGGRDTLDLSAASASQLVLLQAPGSVDGMDGIAGDAPAQSAGPGPAPGAEQPATLAASGGFRNFDVLRGGSSSADQIVGLDADATWQAAGAVQQVQDAGGATLALEGVERWTGGAAADRFELSGSVALQLAGGAGDDRFVLADGSQLTGTVDGGAGSDTLDLAAALQPQDVTLEGLGTTDGFAGRTGALAQGFDGIDHLVGGAGAGDRLTGRPADARWLLTGASGQYLAGRTLAFSGFEALQGSDAADSVALSGTVTASLATAGGNDQFILANGARLLGTLDGGAGTDLLDLSDDRGGVTVDLAAGTATGITGALAGIENVSAGSGADLLRGDGAANRLSGGGGGDRLEGGGSDDTLVVQALAGAVVDGGSGTDSLLVRGTEGDDSLTVRDDRVELGADPVDVARWTAVERLAVDALGGADALRTAITAAGPATTLDGGNGTDSIAAGNAAATWTVTGPGSGTVANGATVAFSQVETVLGGSGVDTLTVVPDEQDDDNDARRPKLEIQRDQVQVSTPTAANPAAAPLSVVGMEQVLSLAVPTTLLVTELAPVTVGLLGGSTVVGPALAGGTTWLIGTAGTLLGSFGAVLTGNAAGSGGTQLTIETTSPPAPAPDAPATPPTHFVVSNAEDVVRNDPDDPDNDDLDDEVACDAEYTIDAGGATFEAADCINIWNITGPNSGVLLSDGIHAKVFTNVGNLVGGLLSDTFIVGPLGSLTGSIDGGGPAFSNSLTTLGGNNSWTLDEADGGSVTGIAGGFEAIANLTGGLGNDSFTLEAGGSLSGVLTGGLGSNSLQGADTANTWTVTGLNAGTVNGLSLGFTAIGNLVGGAGSDSFSLTAGSLTGGIDGGAGLATQNTLTGFVAGADWTLTGTNSGTVSGLGDGFENIGNLSGGVGVDRFTFEAGGVLDGRLQGGGLVNELTGPDSDATWQISGAVSGSLSAGGRTLTGGGFADIGKLTGGRGADTFTLQAAGRLTVGVDGGAGNSAANRLVGPDQALGWTIDGTDSGSLGTRVPLFQQIGSLQGGTAADSFVFGAAGTLSGSLDGGAQAGAASRNTLQGRDSGGIWQLDGTDSGLVSSSGAQLVNDGFVNIGRLQGGSGADRFVIASNGRLSGGLDGGAQDGDAQRNTLQGPNVATRWQITGSDSGNLADPAGTARLGDGFVQVGRLQGGSAADVFVLDAGARLSGSLDGGAQAGDAQRNTLQGPDAASQWQLTGADRGTLADSAGQARVAGGFSQVGNLQGGRAADRFGLATGASLSGGIDGGEQPGEDAFNTLAGPDASSVFTVTGADSGTLANAASQALLATGFRSVANLVGGDQQDRFVLGAQGSLRGSIDGGVTPEDRDLARQQANSLTGPDARTAWVVRGKDAGTVRDATGNALLGGGFRQIGQLTGGTQADQFRIEAGASLGAGLDGGVQRSGQPETWNTLVGPDVATAWAIVGTDAGYLSSSVQLPISLRFADFAQVAYLQGGTAGDLFSFESRGAEITGGIDGGEALGGLQLLPNGASGALPGNAILMQSGFAGVVTVDGADSGIVKTGREERFVSQMARFSSLGSMVFLGSQTVEITDAGSLSGRVSKMETGGPLTVALNGLAGQWTLGKSGAGNVADATGKLLIAGGFDGAGRVRGDGDQADTFTLTDNFDGEILSSARNTATTDLDTLVSGITQDKIRDTDTIDWTLRSAGDGELGSVGTRWLSFRGIANVVGSGVADRFELATKALSGTLDGGGGNDTLVAAVSLGQESGKVVWTVTGNDAGTVDDLSGTAPLQSFSRIGNLVGSAAVADTFQALGPDLRLTGVVDGNGGRFGNDTVVGPDGVALQWVINGENAGRLQRQGDLSEAVTQVAAQFKGVQNLVGGSLGNTLQLRDLGSLSGIFDASRALSLSNRIEIGLNDNRSRTWNITGEGRGDIEGIVGSFRNIGVLQGGISPDRFVVQASRSQQAGLPMFIDGGGLAGVDSLTIADSNGVSHFWQVSGTDKGMLYAGAVPSLALVSFSQIGNLGGSAGVDAFQFTDQGWLTGPRGVDGGPGVGVPDRLDLDVSADATWTVTRTDAGSVAWAGLQTSFSNLRVLNGSQGNDSFFLVGGTLSPGGRIDGRSGTNSLFGLAAPGEWLLTAPNFGTYLGGGSAVSFQAIQNLNGGPAVDLFRFQRGVLYGSGSVDGGGGEDTIVQEEAVDTTWVFTGADSGTVSDATPQTFESHGVTVTTNLLMKDGFRNIEHVIGGAADDRFVVPDGVTFAGRVDGGDGADTVVAQGSGRITGAIDGGANPANQPDVADFSAATGAVTIDLSQARFANVDRIIGNGNTMLVGAAQANFWVLSAPGQGLVNGIAFSGVSALTGGALQDNFKLLAGGSLAGRIRGGAGADTLDGGSQSDPFTVTLTGLGSSDGFAGTQAVLGGGFDGIDAVVGGNGSGTLQGADLGAAWTSTDGAGSYTAAGRSLAHSGFETLRGGALADTFQVASNRVALTVDGGAGDDSVLLGSAAAGTGGTVNGLLAVVTVQGGSGNDSLRLDDSGDTLANTATLTASTVAGLGTAGITHGGVEQLAIALGSGADTVTVQATAAGQTVVATAGGNDSVQVQATGGALRLDTGDGNDAVQVRSNTAALVVAAGNGDDTVVIGSLAPSIGGLLNGVAGAVTLDGGTGRDTLQADDSGDTAANTGTLGASSLTGLGLAGGITYGGFEALALDLGAGADSLAVAGTHAGSTQVNTRGGADSVVVQASGGVLTLSTGDGNDSVSVRAIGAAASVLAGAGDDSIVVGSTGPALGGTVNSIAAQLTVAGDTGNDALTVDDSGDTAANTAVLAAQRLDGLGLAAGLVHGDLESLTLQLGSGADNVTVNGTHAGSTTVNTGAGSDRVAVQAASGATVVNTGSDADSVTVQATAAAVTVNAGAGGDAVTVDQAQGAFNQGQAVNRSLVDTAVGSIFVLDQPLGAAGAAAVGRVSTWQFFQDNAGTAGRQITPLLLERVAGQWQVVGVGTTREANASGLQRWDFGLVAGSDSATGRYFGWKDGAATGADNAGVPEFDTGALVSGTAVWLGPNQGAVGAGRVLAEAGRFQRSYAIEALVSTTAAAVVNGDDGDDQIQLRDTTGQVVVAGLAGNDTVTVGNATTGTVQFDGGLGADRLLVDDNLDRRPNAATLTASTLLGLGIGGGALGYANVETLDVVMGGAPVAFTSGNQPAPVSAGPAQGQSFTPGVLGSAGLGVTAPASGTVLLDSFSVQYAPGAPVFDRLAIYASLPTRADAATGAGALANLRLIGNGTYVVDGPALQLDVNTRYFAVLPDVATVVLSNGNRYGGGGVLADLAPGDGLLDDAAPATDIGFLARFSATNSLLVAGTSAAATTVFGTAGTDVFTVAATGTGALTLNAGDGNDHITVGAALPQVAGTLEGIRGALQANGQGGTDTLVVDSRAVNAAQAVLPHLANLTSNALTGLGLGGGQLGYGTVEEMALRLGADTNETYVVGNRAAGPATALRGVSFTPAQLGNAGTGTARPAAGNVLLDSLVLDLGANVTSPAQIGLYTALPTVADAAIGTSAFAIGTRAANGSYVFDGVALDVNTRYHAVLPVAVNLLAATGNTYTAGAALLDLGNDGQLDEATTGLDVGFRALFRVPNTVLIDNTGAASTQVVGSAGVDLFHVGATSGAAVLQGRGGDDRFTVGTLAPHTAGSLNRISTPLVLDGGAGSDQVWLDDRLDTAPNSGVLSPTAVSGLGMAGPGVGYVNNERLTLQLGRGDDRLDVTGTAPGTQTVVFGGPGNDVVTGRLSGVAVVSAQPAALAPVAPTVAAASALRVASVAPAADALAATAAAPQAAAAAAAAAPTTIDNLVFNGGDGNDQLTLDDTADAGATALTITSTTITGTGIGTGVGYASVENLDLQAGAGGSNYSVLSSVAGTTLKLTGSAGNDNITLAPTAADIVYDAGAGDDVVRIGEPNRRKGLTGKVTVIGGAGNDTLIGSSADDVLYGDGADGERATDGDDVLIGGLGNDRIDAGGGHDLVFGDLGRVTVSLVRGDDDSRGRATQVVQTAVETVVEDDGGHDAITTGSGDDLVFGGAGNDSIQAGEGRNIAIGDGGSLVYRNGQIQRLEASASGCDGDDILQAGGGDDLLLGGGGIDRLDAGQGNNLLMAEGGRLSWSGSRLDEIESRSASNSRGDVLKAGSGNDLLFGSDRWDRLDAGAGSNRLLPNGGEIDGARDQVLIDWTNRLQAHAGTTSDSNRQARWLKRALVTGGGINPWGVAGTVNAGLTVQLAPAGSTPTT